MGEQASCSTEQFPSKSPLRAVSTESPAIGQIITVTLKTEYWSSVVVSIGVATKIFIL